MPWTVIKVKKRNSSHGYEYCSVPNGWLNADSTMVYWPRNGIITLSKDDKSEVQTDWIPQHVISVKQRNVKSYKAAENKVDQLYENENTTSGGETSHQNPRKNPVNNSLMKRNQYHLTPPAAKLTTQTQNLSAQSPTAVTAPPNNKRSRVDTNDLSAMNNFTLNLNPDRGCNQNDQNYVVSYKQQAIVFFLAFNFRVIFKIYFNENEETITGQGSQHQQTNSVGQISNNQQQPLVLNTNLQISENEQSYIFQQGVNANELQNLQTTVNNVSIIV